MKKTIAPCLAMALLLLSGCSGNDDKSVNLYKNSSYARSVVYSCDNGMDFVADFSGDQVTLSIADGPIVNLKQQHAASGMLYSNSSYELRGKGSSAVLRPPGKQPTNCLSLD